MNKETEKAIQRKYCTWKNEESEGKNFSVPTMVEWKDRFLVSLHQVKHYFFCQAQTSLVSCQPAVLLSATPTSVRWKISSTIISTDNLLLTIDVAFNRSKSTIVHQILVVLFSLNRHWSSDDNADDEDDDNDDVIVVVAAAVTSFSCVIFKQKSNKLLACIFNKTPFIR